MLIISAWMIPPESLEAYAPGRFVITIIITIVITIIITILIIVEW